jgi:hypothetical protein
MPSSASQVTAGKLESVAVCRWSLMRLHCRSIPVHWILQSQVIALAATLVIASMWATISLQQPMKHALLYAWTHRHLAVYWLLFHNTSLTYSLHLVHGQPLAISLQADQRSKFVEPSGVKNQPEYADMYGHGSFLCSGS